MRKIKKFLGMLLTLCLIGLMAVSVFAAEAYTYTITLSAGGKGSFSGNSTIELDGISYDANDRINLTSYMNQVTVTDGKYYVKGFHQSGQEDLVASVPKTGDAVYVVTYGVLGNAVSYTVNYQDADGNTLAPSESFYGNVGDKPVVAFVYIEGYQPQAYNLTKTLSENEAENVFTFTYTSLASGTSSEITPSEGGTEGSTATDANGAAGTGTEGTGAGTGTGTGTGTTTTGGAGTADGNNGEADNADNTVVVPDEETPTANPEEIIDLDGDDEEVPLGLKVLEDDVTGTLLNRIRIIIGAAAVIIILVLGWLYMKQRKAKRG